MCLLVKTHLEQMFQYLGMSGFAFSRRVLASKADTRPVLFVNRKQNAFNKVVVESVAIASWSLNIHTPIQPAIDIE